LLLKHAGAARFAYNWGLSRRIMESETLGESLNAIALHGELIRLKRTTLPWMYEVSKCAPQEALRDLDKAFGNFHEGRSRFPRFRCRKRGMGGFRLIGSIKVHQDCVQLPRLGNVRLKEKGYLPTNGVHILSVTVSEKAGRWFVSLRVRQEIQVLANDGPVVGVDLGVSHLATVSDGEFIENPRALQRYSRKLRRLQRKLSRKRRDSGNWTKARQLLAKCHHRVACIRSDAVHKATTRLARTKSVIVTEDLATENLIQNHRLPRSLADASFGVFERMLQYKTRWYGSVVVKADRFFPSTKRCSTCSTVKADVLLSQRILRCDACGVEVNRDPNAALNLEHVAASWAETVNACERREVHATGQVLANEAGTERSTRMTAS
jgi:putative transposase